MVAHPGRVAATRTVAGTAAYLFGRRPWVRSGASGSEVSPSLPGDEILEDVSVQATSAVTIDAPAERVWPWLAQMGHGRGGDGV